VPQKRLAVHSQRHRRVTAAAPRPTGATRPAPSVECEAERVPKGVRLTFHRPTHIPHLGWAHLGLTFLRRWRGARAAESDGLENR
jgi:hypothetical protein